MKLFTVQMYPSVQALSVAFIVTYTVTILNLVEYNLIELSSGPRLASNMAFLAALAIPPVMAIAFFLYWTHRSWTTMRTGRDKGYLGALKVSFLGISTLHLQAGLIMQSYHALLQQGVTAQTQPCDMSLIQLCIAQAVLQSSL